VFPVLLANNPASDQSPAERTATAFTAAIHPPANDDAFMDADDAVGLLG
jgi:hypothetical protein